MLKKNFAKYQNKAAKDAATPPRTSTREGRLYQKMGRAGENEINALDWLRSWKQWKMGGYSPEFLQSLTDFVRIKYDIEDLVKEMDYEPEVPTTKDFWTPSVIERAELATLEGDDRTWREREMLQTWFAKQSRKNAEIRQNNDLKKAERDAIAKDGGKNRKKEIGKLIGEILGDMSESSRLEVESWVRPADSEPDLAYNEPRELVADNMSEAREKGDFLFVFEAVQNTHLLRPMPKVPSLAFKQRENLIKNLSKIKYENGTFDRFLQRFEDYVLICETAGCVIEDAMKNAYLMDGLNPKIFETVLIDWKKTIGRPEFPEEYDKLKELLRGDY